MSIDPHAETPLSQKAAEPVDPPSWSGPVTALQDAVARHDAADAKHDQRLANLETGFARIEQKVDSLTVVAGEIKGLLHSPKARWIILTIAGAAYVYAKAHNVKIPFLEDQ